jgi:Bifunctional DNA primase/polymerase, N-terminal
MAKKITPVKKHESPVSFPPRELLAAYGAAAVAVESEPDYNPDASITADELLGRFLAARTSAHTRANGSDPNPCRDGALMLVERFGWSVFPARFGEDGRKYSYLSADYSGGANWGHTKNPKKLVRYYRQFPQAGVGVPCWPINPVFDLEADTKEGHNKDGLAALAALEAKHGKLPETLMFVSPTGSVHRIFKWPDLPDGMTIPSTNSKIAHGVDVIAANYMFVAPPSMRPGKGVYRWINDLPIADALQWLLDLIVAPAAADDAQGEEPSEELVADDIDELAYGVSLLPNNLPGWKAWKDFCLALYNAVDSDEEALAKIFHKFSTDWTEGAYDADFTDTCIKEVCARPPRSSGPNAAGAGKIYWMIEQVHPGWRNDYREQRDAQLRDLFSTRAESAAPQQDKPLNIFEAARAGSLGASPRQAETKKLRAKTADQYDVITGGAYDFPDEVTLERWDWLYGRHLLRSEVSGTAAMGGIGKTTLSTSEALAMASR